MALLVGVWESLKHAFPDLGSRRLPPPGLAVSGGEQTHRFEFASQPELCNQCICIRTKHFVRVQYIRQGSGSVLLRYLETSVDGYIAAP